MKKWPGSILLIILFTFLIIKYLVIEKTLAEKSFQKFLYNTKTFETLKRTVQIAPNPSKRKADTSNVIISTKQLLTNLTIPNSLTFTQLNSIHTWKTLIPLISISNTLPQTTNSIKEAIFAWKDLLKQIKINKKPLDTKQCPYSVKEMNTSKLSSEKKNELNFKMKIPCGMVSGSTLTIIGTPGGLFGNFRIELIGSSLPGEPDPPVILHYNVRLFGDRVTEDPVIVQNTWNNNDEWGLEERCPSDKESEDAKKVDGSELCRVNTRKDEKQILTSRDKTLFNITERSLYTQKDDEDAIKNFPFKQGFLAIAILRIGAEGIHMFVDGKHVTSFYYRLNLEPWLVSQVRVSGDINLLSVIASGLPISENIRNIVDLEMLKAPQIAPKKSVYLFIGVVSTANNFKRRMAVRRTWMQYEDVRSQKVIVRFFVGLHKNGIVNKELWNEATTYGDIQILPFVDYYDLITWKTIAICIYGAEVVSAKYIMKTDDDAFVRIDRILASIKQTNITHGLLYGRINTDSGPHRKRESKWYISPEEWGEEKYPPWAHGPGYVVSNDIAKAVYEKHKNGSLRMFKLEDVAMGIWIDKMKKEGLDVKYMKDDNIYIEGCEENYVVAHYQEPRGMLCLWEKLQATKRAICCN